MLSEKQIKDFEKTLKLHTNYDKDKNYGGAYLRKMDSLASGYQGSLSQKISYLFDDYYKTINELEGTNINSLESAFNRLRKIELESKNKIKESKEDIDTFNDFDR